MEIWYDGSTCHIGEYAITGNYDDGYNVYQSDDLEEYDEAEVLFSDKSFEDCVVWCLNS